MNGRLGKARFHSLRIILDSGLSSSIVLEKNIIKLGNTNTQPVTRSTQGGDFMTTHTANVEFWNTGIWYDKKRDMEFSCERLARKWTVRHDNRSVFVVVTPNIYMFTGWYYWGKWRRVRIMHCIYERKEQRLCKKYLIPAWWNTLWVWRIMVKWTCTWFYTTYM